MKKPALGGLGVWLGEGGLSDPVVGLHIGNDDLGLCQRHRQVGWVGGAGEGHG